MTERIVLVVEDDFTNQLLMEKMLIKLGLSSEKAFNGQNAVDLFEPGKYCLVIMDLGLPVLNGIEATVAIRKKEAGSSIHTPIIALTAHVYQEDKKKCMDAGMDDYLAKPINDIIFKKAVMKHLEL